MSDFFDLQEEDLDVPENLLFTAKEPVEFIVIDFKQNDEKDMVTFNLKVMTGEHKDRVFAFYLRKKNKYTMVPFLTAFWTRDQIKNKESRWSDLIGRTFMATPRVPREYNGKKYQDFEGFLDKGNVIKDEDTKKLPF